MTVDETVGEDVEMADALAQKELFAVPAKAPNPPPSDDESFADEELTADEPPGADAQIDDGNADHTGSALDDEQENKVEAAEDDTEEFQDTVP
eukprot:12400123-Karenia_brevis.AAC.1